LLKPFEERELYIAIEMALHKHSMEAKTKAEHTWPIDSLDTIGDAIIATNPQGQINFINQTAALLTGWSQAEALGQDVTEIFHIINQKTGTSLENPIIKALREGLLESVESITLLIDKAGVGRLIDKCAVPIRDKTGQLIEVILVFRDLHEQIQ
jgi:two-component system, cell cycle sensor histidine kinase and response regulator CckA